MNILIVCVNYNSYEELNRYLISIDRAGSESPSSRIEVVVADNSPQNKHIDFGKYKNIVVRCQKQSNLGYLPGAINVMNGKPNIADYDYVIISNVDLEIEKRFFSKLETKSFDENVAWVATQIWSEQEHRDKNPKVIERYSKKKLEIIRLLYKYPILDYIYTNSLYLRKRTRECYPERDIYAGHGSFIMLTRRFFYEYKTINYPVFLFGEELFLAELIKEKSLKVRYMPDLRVIDKEHTSTAKMRKKTYYNYNLQSIEFILRKFYE